MCKTVYLYPVPHLVSSDFLIFANKKESDSLSVALISIFLVVDKIEALFINVLEFVLSL